VDFAQFVDDLLSQGRIRVPRPGPLASDELERTSAVLVDYERLWRLTLPEGVPEYDAQIGVEAALRFYRACQCVIDREIAAEQMQAALGIEPDWPNDPATHYAVDLTHRYLPDLIRFARGKAEHDPLVDHLTNWARRWPLSSIGLNGLEGLSAEVLRAAPALVTMYADRVLARCDASRLGDPITRAAVLKAIGAMPRLAGKLQPALANSES
jgi:hypothetical protein